MTDQPDPGSREAPPFFSGLPMHDYFCRMAELGSSTTMPPSAKPFEWQLGEPFEPTTTFEFDGQERVLDNFLKETDTAALIVLQHGKIRHESYALTGGPQVPWLSMSVAKSFISALVGIAAHEGFIGIDR